MAPLSLLVIRKHIQKGRYLHGWGCEVIGYDFVLLPMLFFTCCKHACCYIHIGFCCNDSGCLLQGLNYVTMSFSLLSVLFIYVVACFWISGCMSCDLFIMMRPLKIHCKHWHFFLHMHVWVLNNTLDDFNSFMEGMFEKHREMLHVGCLLACMWHWGSCLKSDPMALRTIDYANQRDN
jgi:hypothetical protein